MLSTRRKIKNRLLVLMGVKIGERIFNLATE